MGGTARTTLLHYGGAVFFTALAVLLRSLLDPLMGDTLPLVTLFGAVAAAVWLGGYRPALIVVASGYLACAYLFIEPRGTFGSTEARSLVGLVAYLATCSIIIGFGEAMHAFRRRADQQRESLRITMTCMGDAVITTDAEGQVTSLNPVAVALTGWTQDEAAGRPLEEVFRIFNEQTRQLVESPVEQVLAAGRVVGLANHTILIARDGKERPIDDSAAPIKDGQGLILGVVLIFRDVTERRRAERSARLLASIVESSDDAIIGKDVNGIITSWNKGAERIFGYTAAEALGRPIAMLAAPDRPDEMPGILDRIRRGERVDHFDTLRRAKDGRLIPISLTVSPVQGEDGQIVGASKIAKDISERKRAEKALHEEKERLRVTLASIGDAVIATDAEGSITSMNAVAESLTGWTQGEVVGKPLDTVFDIVNEETRKGVENSAKRALTGGVIVGLANHTVLIGKDGTERPIDDSAAPIKNPQGQVLGCVLIFRDISERRRAEAEERCLNLQLQERVQELQTLLEILPVQVWIGDAECKRITGNAAAYKAHGFEPGINVSFDAPFPELPPGLRIVAEGRDLQPPEMPMQLAARTGKPVVAFEHDVVHQDGRRISMLANVAPLLNSTGKVRGVVGVYLDVTDRKQADGLRRQSEQRLAAELESLSRLHALSTRLLSTTDLSLALDDLLENAILTSGADFGNVQLVNPQTGALEIAAQRGFEQDFLDYFRTVRVDEGSACAEAMRSGTRIIIEDVELDPAFEPHRRIAAAAGYRAVQSTPLEAHSGAVVGMLSTHFRLPHRPSERDQRLLDLYARHAADFIERLRYEQALENADRRKDEFLAMLAHELRNPLAPIHNTLEIMKRAEGDGDLHRQARSTMEQQLAQLVRLLDDLMDVSRISRNKVELRKERVELAPVIHQALEACRTLAEGAGHQVSVTLPPGPIYLHADPVRLAQVFSNLLNNACKYTEAGGKIWLNAERQGSDVVVRLRDTGLGIPPDKLDSVFELFTQIDRTLERSQGGLGIGLSLVKRLVEMHDGRVDAHSEGPGRGSEFVARLPILIEAAMPAPPSPDAEATATPRRILVVDDNPAAAFTLAKLLQVAGNEVQTADNGLEALETAERFRPEVIFLDIGLPRLNGYDVCRRIREQPWGKDMMLVALTGWGQDDDRRKSKDAGFDHHMVKPVNFAALQRLLASVGSTEKPT